MKLLLPHTHHHEPSIHPMQLPTRLAFLLVARGGTILSEACDGVDYPPLVVHFPRASPATMRTLLYSMCPLGVAPELFRAFVDHVRWGGARTQSRSVPQQYHTNTTQTSHGVQVDRAFGFLVGHDVTELTYLVKTLFPAYLAPVLRQEVHRADASRLRALAAPAFDAARRRFVFHDVLVPTSAPAAAAAAARVDDGGAGSSVSTPPPVTRPRRERGVDLELPYFTKLLLLAAFCASHNPASSDARLFGTAKPSRASGPTTAGVRRRVGGP